MIRNLAIYILSLMVAILGVDGFMPVMAQPMAKMPSCCMAMLESNLADQDCCCPSKTSCKYQNQSDDRPVLGMTAPNPPRPAALALDSMNTVFADFSKVDHRTFSTIQAKQPSGPLYIYNSSFLI